MILGKVIGKQLLEMGIDTLYLRGIERPFLQHLGLKFLLYDWGIKRGIYYGKRVGEEFGISFITGRGNELATESPHPNGEKVEIDFPPFPLFIVDFSLWNRHSESEKRKLASQTLMLISTIRKHLWDYNLSLNHTSQELEHLIKVMGFPNKVRRDVMPPSNTLILDPYAEDQVTEEQIRSTDCFVLGGIVDDSGWKYATKEMAKEAGYSFRHVKIALRGSRLGVPDRLNKIASIILRVKEGETLEDSILNEQSNADKFLRLLRDTTLNGDLERNAQWLRAGEKVKQRVRRITSRTRPESFSSHQ
ncbi:tRNA (adenine(9)-N1)-methyltransferase Trm10 [Metallosphaera cuprina]|uniref:tRNA (adenine(9)-N1)-methyltransferase Trm10 n=1 Tax=Metallosphaera cuprina TaxID=1006005 RepID=UPI00064ED87F|nr:tRNA (adenine(9)-N1)-methyltransferase Trm10 [Metallosphaera cuprina]